jgi:superfamily II DNA or RNA helicase
MEKATHFLDPVVLLEGGPRRLPVATERMMWHLGFDGVRVIDGARDNGADVLASRGGELWVVQDKWKARAGVSDEALNEVDNARRHYGADRAAVASNSFISPKALRRAEQLRQLGAPVELWDGRRLNLVFEAMDDRFGEIESRAYQEEAVASLRRDLEERGAALLVLATGLGKTVIGGEVIRHELERRPGVQILVVAHLKELVQQLERAMWRHLSKDVRTQVLTGDDKPRELPGVTFATVESALSAVREDDYRPSLVMVDETHHVGEENNFQKLLDELAGSRQFGVTATPWRGDKFDVAERFGKTSFQMGIAEGMSAGFLAQVDYRLYVDNVDWDVVAAASERSYSIKELNEALFLPQRDEAIIARLSEAYNATAEPRAIVFCQTIEHAERFAESLRRANPAWKDSRCLHSKLTRPERQAVLADFRLGRVPIITVRDIFNEGVDVPDVNIICFLRVTHSRRIFVQQLGRGLRLAPHKDRVVVLDFITDIRRAAAALGIKREMERLETETVTVSGGSEIVFSDVRVGSLLDAWIEDAADLETSAEEVRLQFPEVEWSLQ